MLRDTPFIYRSKGARITCLIGCERNSIYHFCFADDCVSIFERTGSSRTLDGLHSVFVWLYTSKCSRDNASISLVRVLVTVSCRFLFVLMAWPTHFRQGVSGILGICIGRHQYLVRDHSAHCTPLE